MMGDSAELRIRLIRRLLELPDIRLQQVEPFFDSIEQSSKETGKFQSSVEPEHSQREKCWPHAPVHRVSEHGTYIVTAATLHKQHLFHDHARLDFLEAKLLEGLSSVESELTPADWRAIRKEALAKVEARKKLR